MIISRSLRDLSVILLTLSIIDFTFASECNIKEHQKCHGIIDCKTANEFDRKDESFALCYKKECNEKQFKCTYGGCLDRTLRCDGKPDCWDGSDENKYECSQGEKLQKAYEELYGEYTIARVFACKDKPLEWSHVCDGRADCSDGRDEDPSLCSSIECDPPAFKCLYGGCISSQALCNHIQDCVDGSDEIQEICHNKYNETIGFEAHAKWTVQSCSLQDTSHSLVAEDYVRNSTFRRNAKVPHGTVVHLSCTNGRRLVGNKLNICVDDTWRHPLARCVEECKPLVNILHTRQCTLDGSLIDCDQPTLLKDTRMTVSCASGAEYETPGLLVCDETGRWVEDSKNILPKCEPICGMWKPSQEQPSPPWLMSILKRNRTTAEFNSVCKATILSPFVLVTSADCVSAKDSPLLYTVAEGHLKRASLVPHEPHPYKLHNVSNIHIVRVSDNPLALVQLLHPLEFGSGLAPLCLTNEVPRNWIIAHNTKNGLIGEVLFSDSKMRGRYEISEVNNESTRIHIGVFMKDIRKYIDLTQEKGNI